MSLDISKINKNFLIYLASSFFVFYGVAPLFLVEFLNFKFYGAGTNFIYSIFSCITFILIFVLYEHYSRPSTGLLKGLIIVKIPLRIQFLLTFPIFLIAPWNEDRTSLYASLAAFVRILWLVRIWADSTNKEIKIFERVGLTIVLSIIDGSRTVFFLSLVPYLMRKVYTKKKLLFVVIFLAFFTSIVHYFRIEDANLSDLFLAGFIGEGYWGPYGVSQVLEADLSFNFNSLLMPFFTPLTIPITSWADIYSIEFRSDAKMSELIYERLVEQYYPMAGFYLLSEYLTIGIFGIILMNIYLLYCNIIIRKIFGTTSFPFSILLIIVAIKSSPYTFWKFIWYIFLVIIFIRILGYIFGNIKNTKQENFPEVN